MCVCLCVCVSACVQCMHLSRDNSNLRDGGLGIRIQEFRSLSDYASILLVCAWSKVRWAGQWVGQSEIHICVRVGTK